MAAYVILTKRSINGTRRFMSRAIDPDRTAQSPIQGPVQAGIEKKLNDSLTPLHLEVVNESHMHSVPPGSESHFKVTVVSDKFVDQSPVQRHRTINNLLAAEISGPVHALALHAMTPDEWFEKGGMSEDSPPCRGGSKNEPA